MATHKAAAGSDGDTTDVEERDAEPREVTEPRSPRSGTRVKTVVASELLMLLGLLAFVGVAFGVELAAESPIRLPAPLAVVVAAIPSLLWLGYFYLHDRHEPEPKHYVFGVFLVGAFIAGPIAGFAVAELAPRSPLAAVSLDPLGAERIAYVVLVVAVAQELCKYAAVRYTLYPSAELDEPLDGIIYATAAGIGFATHENVIFLQQVGGEVLLSVGVATAVVTTLAHACFAGVTGYTLGRAKFVCKTRLRRTVTLGVGLLAAIALNGQFTLVKTAVSTEGLHSHPWRGVAFTFGFAAAVFILVSVLARRLLAASPHAPAPLPDVEPEPDELGLGEDE